MLYLYHYKQGLVATSTNSADFTEIMDELGGCFSIEDHELTVEDTHDDA